MDNVSKIVSMYRADRNMTQGEFAEALTERLTDRTLTGAAVSYWERGERHPNYQLLLKMAMQYDADPSDWRAQFAMDVLSATLRGQYKPIGAIGRHILLGEPLDVVEGL